jgi:integrase
VPKTLTRAAVERLKPLPGRRRVVRDAASPLILVIHPTGRKSWMLRFRRPDGTIANFVLGPVDLSGSSPGGENPKIGQPLSLVAARQLAAKVNAERAAGRDVVADRKASKHRQRVAVAEARANSFAAAAHDFITEHAKAKTRGWKETAANLGLNWRDLSLRRGGLAERWADRSVKHVDAHDLFAAIDEARRIGTPGIAPRRNGKSEARARKLHGALSVMFSWLQRHRRIELDPMASLHKPDPAAKRDRVLTDAEIRKFWAATDRVAAPFGAVLKLLLLTGARLNEIARLRWEEAGEGGTVLNIPGSRTKNHLPFVIPLPPVAQEIVASAPRVDDDCAFVFTTNNLSSISGWSKLKRRLDAAMGSAQPWRIHDLRRTAATGMASIGVQPHVVEACLNHVSGYKAGVAGIYNQHAYRAEKEEALARWADHLAGVAIGSSQKVVPIRGGRR